MPNIDSTVNDAFRNLPVALSATFFPALPALLRHPAFRCSPAVCAFAFLLITTGCVGSRVALEDSKTGVRSDASHSAPDVERRIRDQYDRWSGTPHVLGGSSARGMDCSAYVQRVFDDAFATRLPRTTDQQVREGRPVSRNELQPGDLVFFRPRKTQHVGIYLGDGEFTHASSSSGVTVSRMDEPYWSRSYWTARRILPSSDSFTYVEEPDVEPLPQAPSIEVVSIPQPRRPGGRVGW